MLTADARVITMSPSHDDTYRDGASFDAVVQGLRSEASVEERMKHKLITSLDDTDLDLSELKIKRSLMDNGGAFGGAYYGGTFGGTHYGGAYGGAFGGAYGGGNTNMPSSAPNNDNNVALQQSTRNHRVTRLGGMVRIR